MDLITPTGSSLSGRLSSWTAALDGIPHHGVFFIKSCALLLTFFAWIGITTMAVRDGLCMGEFTR